MVASKRSYVMLLMCLSEDVQGNMLCGLCCSACHWHAMPHFMVAQKLTANVALLLIEGAKGHCWNLIKLLLKRCNPLLPMVQQERLPKLETLTVLVT